MLMKTIDHSLLQKGAELRLKKGKKKVVVLESRYFSCRAPSSTPLVDTNNYVPPRAGWYILYVYASERNDPPKHRLKAWRQIEDFTHYIEKDPAPDMKKRYRTTSTNPPKVGIFVGESSSGDIVLEMGRDKIESFKPSEVIECSAPVELTNLVGGGLYHTYFSKELITGGEILMDIKTKSLFRVTDLKSVSGQYFVSESGWLMMTGRYIPSDI